MREKLNALPLTELREIAKHQGIKNISKMKKDELIEKMLEVGANHNNSEEQAEKKTSDKRQNVRMDEKGADGNVPKANGILEVMPDGYGFIRCENFLPGEDDVYVHCRCRWRRLFLRYQGHEKP